MSYTHLPRLYVDTLKEGAGECNLFQNQAHHLQHVLRLKVGDHVRVFHPSMGEYLGELVSLSKKGGTVRLMEPLRKPTSSVPLHLVFAPLRQHRQSYLIEKCVEIGVTHFHPVLTARGQVRQINPDRIHAEIVEASEQCERLDIPSISELQSLSQFLKEWPTEVPLLVGRERLESAAWPKLNQASAGFCVGPEGGFADEEWALFAQYPFVHFISLGANVLRAETAALVGCSWVKREI